jgi:hypothetical protein
VADKIEDIVPMITKAVEKITKAQMELSVAPGAL